MPSGYFANILLVTVPYRKTVVFGAGTEVSPVILREMILAGTPTARDTAMEIRE